MASQTPARTPCRAIASAAYVEQDGTKRQCAPSQGETAIRYERITNTATRAAGASPARGPRPPSVAPAATSSSRTDVSEAEVSTPRWARLRARVSRFESECASELVVELIVAEISGAWPGNDQHVARGLEPLPVEAKKFAHQAPHTVPLRSCPNLAAGRDTEPRWRSLLRASDDYEM